MPHLAADLQHWLTTEKARGCLPHSLIESMVQAGHPRAYAQAAVAQTFGQAEFSSMPASSSPSKIQYASAQAPNAIALPDLPERKIDVLFALAAPRALLFANFLNAQECTALIALARQQMKPALVVDPQSGEYVPDKSRVSEATYFPHGHNELISTIEHRVETLLGFAPQRQEALQVLHYGVGGGYEPHYDYFNPAEPGSAAQLQRGGQRIATFIMYLNAVDDGGATAFPNVGLEVKPQPGNALYFESLSPAGQLDTNTLHAGTPVVQGEKWIATKWLREHAIF